MTDPTPKITALSWTGRTHVGRFRKNNEDAFLALTFDEKQVQYLGKDGDASLAMGDYIFAVSDGMGGAKAGEFASKIAVDKITEMMPRCFRLPVREQTGGGAVFLEKLMSGIHNQMRKHGRHYEECHGMGATLSLCWLTSGAAYFAHVGDSRIYHLPREGPMRQLTEDHTHVGWLFRKGKLSAAEVRVHPKRNELQMVLGGRAEKVDPQTGTIDLEAGDSLVLCTDGINAGISDSLIEATVRSANHRLAGLVPAERLVQEALEESGKDNLTALVITVS